MPYTPEQIEKTIEAFLHEFFGDSLNAQQRTIAADIAREVYYSAEAESTPFETWQARVSTLQQQWQQHPCVTPEDQQLVNFARLWLQWLVAAAMQQIFHQSSEHYDKEGVNLSAQIATGKTDAVVKNLILKIYYDAGVTQGQRGNSAEELKYYDQGLSHAHDWLVELTPDAKATVLSLCLNAGGTQGQLGNSAEQLKYYDQGLSHAHDWLAELTPEAKATVLRLCYNAGGTQGQLGNSAEGLKYCEQGLNHAHDWLAELTPDAKATVLQLYGNYSATYYNSSQIAQIISLLPDKGMWSWVGFKHSDHKNQEIILRNWQNNLNIQYSPAQLIAAFQHCFYALLTRDHDPTQAARPFGFITTATLLQLSETLYALDQALSNSRLREMYHALQQLHEHEPDWIAATDQLPQLRAQKLKLENQFAALKWWQWWQRSQLRTDLHICTHKIQHLQRTLSFEHWQRQFEKSQAKLLNWLYTGLTQSHQLTDGLTELSSVVLGILAVYAKPEQLIELSQCWQDSEHLQTALAPTHWKTWARAQQTAPLCIWLDLLPPSPNKQRLTIPQAIAFFEQPTLQNWLLEFMNGNFQPLQAQLNLAWERARRRAKQLTELFGLFLPEKIAHQHCITAILLGDETTQLTQLIQKKLQEYAPITEEMSILEAFTTLKQRFTYCVSLYEPIQSNLAATVHDWSRVRLQEILQVTPPNNAAIWNMLERSRVGLMGLRVHLEEDWQDTLSHELWTALAVSIQRVASGEDTEQQMYPPLELWLNRLNPTPPVTVEECQMRLRPGEALLQPFFDENQQVLCLLWLDRKTLSLLDMPENCARGSDWETFVETWESALDDKNTDQITPLLQDSIFAHAAHYLAKTAQHYKITQLTVIFPAPLGQLPWEALPALENSLVREISVNHWYQNQPVTQTGAWVLGMGNVTTELGCCNTEARWVAECWNTTATCPDQPLETFEVLQQLATQRHLFLSTHAGFNLHDPLASGLSLGQHKTSDKIGVDLPLWLCSAISTPCELLVLSACQSNLTGKQTQGILSPVGIAPSFAAAGARTVIGTLWQVKDLTSLCFHYHLFTLAETHPELPWHQLMTLARRRLREMTIDELKQLRTQLKINNDQIPKCFAATADFIAHAKRKKCLPFEHPREWAAFTVCGMVSGQQN